MTAKYLVRLDDASPFMDRKKWGKIEEILDKYNVKPLVGVIPNNQDPEIMIEEKNSDFPNICKEWMKKDWQIALHGYTHIYTTQDGGINPIHKRSEYAGHTYEGQCDLISKGYKILKEWCGQDLKYFFAPSHTFDDNTLKALKEKTPIRIISDTMAFKPYKYGDFSIIPQQMGNFRNIKIPGFYTFCFHPNNMDEKAFITFENFIIKNQNKFISFDDVNLNKLHRKSLMSILAQKIYFMIRKIQGKE